MNELCEVCWAEVRHGSGPVNHCPFCGKRPGVGAVAVEELKNEMQ